MGITIEASDNSEEIILFFIKKIKMFFMFLDYFDVLILKIILKNKKYYFYVL